MSPDLQPADPDPVSTPSVRFGVLGAARIAPSALLRPSHRPGSRAAVTVVGARSVDKARAFAAKHGLATAVGSYEEVLAADVDAVYVALPPSLHGRWTVAALEAGKHVLCEKPFTADAEEAERVAEAARLQDRVVMQAAHYRYHPLVERAVAVLASGELGAVRHIDASFHIPIPARGDIRWDLGLGGGSLMDVGFYPVHLLRALTGEEPLVTGASARVRAPGVDRDISVDLALPSGATARVGASMLALRVPGARARVVGERGTMTLSGFVAPQYGHRLAVRTPERRWVEHVSRRPSTYEAQLAAFTAAVLDGGPVLTGPDDAVATMRVLDAGYRAAGLDPRRPAGLA